ncbi:MAG: dipeptidase [Chloroflexota bacterium]
MPVRLLLDKENTTFIIDGHLDLAMNALQWNRDLRLPVAEMRRLEADVPGKGRGRSTVAFPEMRSGVGLCIATLIARVAREGNPLAGYRTPDIACAIAHGQLAYYRLLEADGLARIIADRVALYRHAAAWQSGVANDAPLGFILSMEGADPIMSPDQVPGWFAAGLRIVGLTHYGVSTYAHGTGTEGGLTPLGKPLLRAMEAAGMLLDVTHLADQSMAEALDAFGGTVLASHHNCRALVPGDRQLTDDQIRRLVERGAVIGAATDDWMLYPGWVRGESDPSLVSLGDVVDHIDHVCQLAGNSRHSAIGTDLDGGYGTEQTPGDLNTIADLQKLPALLQQRGYTPQDVENILHGNWLRLLERALPVA